MTIFQEKLEHLFGFKFENDFLSNDDTFDKWSETILHKDYKISIKSSIQNYNNNEIFKHVCYSIKLIKKQ